MTKRDMAGILGVDVKTLRNWRKERPELYHKIMQGFKLEQAVEEARKHYEALKTIADSSKTDGSNNL